MPGKLADPIFRRERATKAAVARTTPDYHLTKLEEHVRAVAEGLPPLTDAQRQRLAALLRPSDTGAAAA